MSFAHWIILALLSLIWGVPLYKIATRVGLPTWVAAIALFPVIGSLAIYLYITFFKWPIPDAGAQKYERW